MSLRILEVFADGTTRDMDIADFQRRHAPHVDKRLKTVKKDDKVPKVGDTVRLNDTGLEQIFGRRMGMSHMKTLTMRVTHVDDESVTYPEPTFCVEVDNPEINAFLIDHHCFDIVR